MAVTFDAAGGGVAIGGGTSATNWTWLHTVTGSNTVAIVAMAFGVINLPPNSVTRSVTFGGVPMTSLAACSPEDIALGSTSIGFFEVFYLLNPPSGASTVSVTATGGGTYSSILGNSLSYTGCGSVSNLTLGHAALGVTPSLTVPSGVGSVALAVFGSGGSIGSPTQTQRILINQDFATACGNLLVQDAAGAASVTFGAASNGDVFGEVGVSLDPVVATTQFFAMF